MATPQAPLTPEERIAREEQARYQRLTRNIALGGLIACPVIALLPPRKLDLYTFSLGIGFYLSADHLATQHNGRGLVHQFSNPVKALPTERANEMKRAIDEKRDIERGKEALREGTQGTEANRGLFEKLWMGDEKEGWKERRMQEEKRMLEEGKGYGSMIIDQIWEVWNWDKKNGGEEKKEEEPKK